ncbi:MAG: sigma-70 family RNA polymerase sigma factor, partial [Phycisphaerales bacterium]|nr:sigma-70 family RNA polymerase sigma factor [Phycisphaerales bacterium]
LLTPEQERDLATRIRAASAAQEQLTRGELSPSRYEKIQQDAAEARAQMVQANLRLVISVAKNFRNRGLPMEDLVNEGNLGLMQAVDRFDPDVGSRFSTYASYWIDQSIRRAVQNGAQMIHIPSYLIEHIGRMRLAMRELMVKFGRDPTISELAAHLETTPRKVAAVAQAIRACACPSQSGSADDGATIADSLPDRRTPAPHETVNSESDADFVTKMLDIITDREAVILKLRYGLNDESGKRLTLKEIGDQVGLTRERVRQLEKQAKRKLEEYFKEHFS